MKKTLEKFVLVGLVLALLWLIIGFLVSRYWLKLSAYELRSEKLTAPARIVQLSDLHSTDHGEDLLDIVRAQDPDLIFCTGDLINRWDTDFSVALDVLKSLCDIAPVYVSMGNHEEHYKQGTTCPVDAVDEVLQTINYVCKQTGGRGAVREFVTHLFTQI